MNGLLDRADSVLMTGEERGAAIKRRRLQMGVKSLRQFSDALGMSRSAVTKAEAGDAPDYTLERIEAWLDAREHEMSSDADEARHSNGNGHNGNGNGDEPPVVTIKMSGIYGIDDVTVSGPVEHLSDLRNLAVELMRDVQDRGKTD